MADKIVTRNVNLYYGDNHALKDISLNIEEGKITALIGPSGCGKSTYLKTLNRMNDLVENVKITGQVLLDGEDVYGPGVDVTLLRKKVGMVFQKPNPFPMSVYDNIAYGPRIHGIKSKAKLDEIVEKSLRSAALFNEIKDRLKKSALSLSGGQQQRVAVAVSMICGKNLLVFDEPTSGLDFDSMAQVAGLIRRLSDMGKVIFIVTHDFEFVCRTCSRVLHFDEGEMPDDVPVVMDALPKLRELFSVSDGKER